jgi:putative PIN family toxin of toxin-antitoxin system
MKAVFDTNVLIAAFVTDGLCARILRRARVGEFEFILGIPVLLEFQRILKEKFAFSDADISFFSSILDEAATSSRPDVSVAGVCRDPDDDAVLACAVESEADYLVTGDKDLLVLGHYGKTKILTPREFETLFSD